MLSSEGMNEDEKVKTLLYFYAKNVQKKAAENQPSFEKDPDVQEFCDLRYVGKDGNSLAMDAYRPLNRSGDKLPVVLVVHGGGLMVGDNKIVSVFCRHLAKRGFLVFSLDYRLLTEADARSEINDVCEGFRFAETMIGQFGGDLERVNVFAESAGAFLALYAIASQKSDVLQDKLGCVRSELKIQKTAFSSGMFYTRKLDLIGVAYPMQIYGKDFVNPFFMKYMNPENPEVTGNLPPTLLISSDADFLRKYTLNYDKALEMAGVEHNLVYYTDNKELTHSFAVYRLDLPEAKEVMDRICEHFSGGIK